MNKKRPKCSPANLLLTQPSIGCRCPPRISNRWIRRHCSLRLADLEKQARSRRVSPVVLARLHAMLGEHDKTLTLLD